MHCRLCINCYGTDTKSLAFSLTINAKTTVHCSPDSSMVLPILLGDWLCTVNSQCHKIHNTTLPPPVQLLSADVIISDNFGSFPERPQGADPPFL
jgi:hypothetical protein